MVRKVDELWQKRHRRMLDRASNPLHTQKHMLGESDSSDDDGELEDERRFPHIVKQLKEAEECIVKGRPMDLLTFKRVLIFDFILYILIFLFTLFLHSFIKLGKWSVLILDSQVPASLYKLKITNEYDKLDIFPYLF